jgi:hypothetical protein
MNVMTLSILSFSTATHHNEFSIMTFSTTTLSNMTLSTTTLIIMTLWTMAFSTTTNNVAFSTMKLMLKVMLKAVLKFMRSVITLSVIVMNVAAPKEACDTQV